ncbi:hypothetical protein ASPWEDRAFT_176826 [Aspergillus wentii DTO 134E9]|uniref:Uncharacterized protein n=1 Tax=Aspergillus wentii DTO 134E9 TaxID=1073089 RepID=A0A1L9R5F2_ASPWE|nr:uncharacterized protein ASPWEDRAFT_176826 [Aspergillus wentii DTO 134E9]KAI9925349.1 hypothetical protein MW887_006277 [Aspergillus wentii]OJJ30156.1 hypothetical protein ASPWEDRAFT_176826 [Aspergillus wentii DTO 134E9]
MQHYLLFDIINAFIHRLEANPNNENSLNAVVSGIVNHYFPPSKGYIVLPRRHQNGKLNGFLVQRVNGEQLQGRRRWDHLLVLIKTPDTAEIHKEQRDKEIGDLNTENRSCWGLDIDGVYFRFYEYRAGKSRDDRVVARGPPDHPIQEAYHVRDDVESIHAMLQCMDGNLPSVH